MARRLDTSRLNGVRTTIGTVGCITLIAAAPSKVSLMSLPGMAMMRSKGFAESTSSASSIVETRVTRGGELRLRATYSLYSCSSTRPSSSIMKAS